MIALNVNGKVYNADVEPEMPLLWVLRNALGLTGTKYGCGVSECGACTVHVNGQAKRSCVTPVGSVVGTEITTIEGLGGQHVVQKAWLELDVPQCGYCQPGQIMAAAAMLRRKPRLTDADIDREITNVCRCGTYREIRLAIHRAAEMMAKG